jgi:hypothetical protein
VRKSADANKFAMEYYTQFSCTRFNWNRKKLAAVDFSRWNNAKLLNTLNSIFEIQLKLTLLAEIKPGLINVYWSSADFSIKTEVHGKKCNVFCKDTRLLEVIHPGNLIEHFYIFTLFEI